MSRSPDRRLWKRYIAETTELCLSPHMKRTPSCIVLARPLTRVSLSRVWQLLMTVMWQPIARRSRVASWCRSCVGVSTLSDVTNLVCLAASGAESNTMTRAELIHDATFGCFIRFAVHQS